MGPAPGGRAAAVPRAVQQVGGENVRADHRWRRAHDDLPQGPVRQPGREGGVQVEVRQGPASAGDVERLAAGRGVFHPQERPAVGRPDPGPRFLRLRRVRQARVLVRVVCGPLGGERRTVLRRHHEPPDQHPDRRGGAAELRRQPEERPAGCARLRLRRAAGCAAERQRRHGGAVDRRPEEGRGPLAVQSGRQTGLRPGPGAGHRREGCAPRDDAGGPGGGGGRLLQEQAGGVLGRQAHRL